MSGTILYTIVYYSIQDSTQKVLMDCGKFHVMCDMMLLLSGGRSACK